MNLIKRLQALFTKTTPETGEGPEILPQLLSRFENAREYLTVRLHTKDMYQGLQEGMDTYVVPAPIPDLYVSLALDLPGQFHLLQKSDAEKWGMDEDELLWTAFSNLTDKQEKIRIIREEREGFSVITLSEGDYAAAFAADFENHCKAFIGRIGAMVAFPTKGSVFIYPIKEPSGFNKAFTQMAEQTNKAFRDDPFPLSNNLYWYHAHRFEVFPKSMEAHTLSYSIPNRLLAYLRTPLAHPAHHSDIKDTIIEGDWEGYYEYGQGYTRPQLGSRKSFQLKMKSDRGQVEGSCIDEEYNLNAGIWGFVDRELISFIKKYPEEGPKNEIHFTGFFDKGDHSFTGTWVIDDGNGKISSGSWAMVKI